jgi:hypothetical protein
MRTTQGQAAFGHNVQAITLIQEVHNTAEQFSFLMGYEIPYHKM